MCLPHECHKFSICCFMIFGPTQANVWMLPLVLPHSILTKVMTSVSQTEFRSAATRGSGWLYNTVISISITYEAEPVVSAPAVVCLVRVA